MATPLTSQRMKHVRQRDTVLEMKVRRLLSRQGIRYRVCPKTLPGRPDLANRARRWAVFVHGCFWHGHVGCKLARLPKTNVAFWAAKVDANRARDKRKEGELELLGFRVAVVWQCELEDEAALLGKLRPLFAPQRLAST